MILLFCFAFILVQSLQTDVNAKTKVDNIDIYEGYTVITNNETEFYLRDINNKDEVHLVYCFSNGQLEPPLLDAGKILPRYQEENFVDNKGYAALLYVGYPLDKEGLIKKYGLTSQEAHKETQSALWTLQNADLSIYLQYKKPYPSYYVELLSYAAHHVDTKYDDYKIAYYVSNTVTNENLSYQHLITLNKTNSEGDTKPTLPNNLPDDEGCGCVSKPGTSNLQFWLFIGGAIILILVTIIWCIIKSKKTYIKR